MLGSVGWSRTAREQGEEDEVARVPCFSLRVYPNDQTTLDVPSVDIIVPISATPGTPGTQTFAYKPLGDIQDSNSGVFPGIPFH